MRNSGKRKTLAGALVLSLVTALMPMNANAVEPETTPDVVPDFVLPERKTVRTITTKSR